MLRVYRKGKKTDKVIALKPASSSLGKNQKIAVKQIVTRAIKSNTEYKQYATAFNAPVYAGSIGQFLLPIVVPPQGAPDSDRVGDEITLKHIRMRLSMYNNTSNQVTTWRVLVFQFKQSDLLGGPVLSNILLSSLANGSTSGAFSSRNIDYLGVYNVVYDRFFQTQNATSNQSKFTTFVVPMKYVKKKIQYIAGTTNSTNNMYLLVTTGSGSAANNPSLLGDIAVSYTDS